jgi:SAM dependent carboxyl methyltransferase
MDAADATARAGVMAGAGRYAEESATQHGAASFGFPLIPAAVAQLEPPAGGPLLLADFGAAQGTNSLEAIRRALAALAERVPGRPALVVHSDIPGNDFTTLCDTLETSDARYTRDRPDVLPLMAGRSLYDRVLPPATLSFGWTASTLHWLRRTPGPVTDHFFVQLAQDGDARAAYAEQSARDWRDFLDHRAAELAPGAGIVIVDVAMGEDGTMGSEALFDRLNDALVETREAGLLSAAEFARIVYPTWFRSLAELRAPFAPHHVAPGGEAVELAELAPAILDDPFRPAYERTGDARAYAAAQVGFLAAFLEPSFAAALDRGRPDAERAAVVDEIWERARRLIAAEPLTVSPRYRLVTALIRREH